MSTDTRRFSHYELRERLNQDQLAETWKGYDEQNGRTVIIKSLHLHLQNDAYFLSRFEREANDLKALHHPHLCRIQDIYISNQAPSQNTLAYLIMEAIEGQSLVDYIQNTSRQRNFPPVSIILSLFEALGSAVDYAHQNGIRYCNIKPANILLERSHTSPSRVGIPRLINYEVATLMGNPPGIELAGPPYISPEQLKGASGSGYSDIYLLGCILYEICTGEPPLKNGQSPADLLQSARTIAPPETLNPRIPPTLSAVIMRSLSEDPEARFASGTAFYLAIQDAFAMTSKQSVSVTPPPVSVPVFPSRKRRNPLLIILFALLILGVIVGGFTLLFSMLRAPVVSTPVIVGHAYMESSGQVSDNSTVGLNDELWLRLSNVPEPSSGKSYYLWLLSDIGVKPVNVLPLGLVTIDHGTVNHTYTTPQHTNLLAATSRLLITEEKTNSSLTSYSLDQTTWSYYAEIPQRTVSPGAPHLGAIRFLRFLLFESNKMLAQGIHGGSATALLRNTQKILEWAGSARDDWTQKRYDLIHRHFIRILDYVDGSAFVSADVPVDTPLLVDSTLSLNGMVGIVPGENPESYPPRAAFSILSYIQSVPDLSPERRHLGTDTEKDVRVNLEQHLQQVRIYARQLFLMNDQQLAQHSTLTTLNSMLEEARNAYSGVFDPVLGHSVGGALNDYNNLQLLASYDIAPYAHK